MIESGMFGVDDKGRNRSVDQKTFNDNVDEHREAVFATTTLTKKMEEDLGAPLLVATAR